MRRNLISIVTAVVLMTACDPTSISVVDNSFVFSARTSANGTQNYVSLTLESGCNQARYEVNYIIDDDPSLRLADDHSEEFVSGSGIEFRSGSNIWKLPVLRKGDHSIEFKIRTEDFEQTLRHSFSIDSEPFALHAEVRSDLSAGTSTLLLSLAEGIANKEYTGVVLVDDEVIDRKGFKVNFKDTPIFSVVIPLLRPGSHSITVKMNDDMSEEQVSFLFEEPLRYPDMQVEIARSPSTGKTRFMVRSNPYGLSVEIKDSLVVKGRCDYHRAVEWWEDRMEDKTDYKEVCDVVELPRFLPKTGVWYDLTDTGSRETVITTQFQNNTKWAGQWSNTGEGGWEYYIVSDGVSYYKIESSTHHLKVDFESMLGVTVHVSNSERDVIYNGRPIDKTYSYKISESSR